jgi:hypothetical protein
MNVEAQYFASLNESSILLIICMQETQSIAPLHLKNPSNDILLNILIKFRQLLTKSYLRCLNL